MIDVLPHSMYQCCFNECITCNQTKNGLTQRAIASGEDINSRSLSLIARAKAIATSGITSSCKDKWSQGKKRSKIAE